MPLPIAPLEAQPPGEVLDPRAAAVRAVLDRPLTVDTHGRRFHVEWDPHAPVTPLGQLVFFSQFLATAGLWRDLVRSCPRSFTSHNAPLLPDLLGTMTLAGLAGQNRYAHVTARHVALVYNWWSLFVRCAQPERAREAVTSRPLLLCAVGRVVESGRQLTLRLTSTHAEAARAQRLLTELSLFLSGLQNAAEQLNPAACWERTWARILEPWRRPQAALPGPSG